jgi:hypothetical protein
MDAGALRLAVTIDERLFEILHGERADREDESESLNQHESPRAQPSCAQHFETRRSAQKKERLGQSEDCRAARSCFTEQRGYDSGDCPNVLSLQTLGATRHFKFNLLSLLKGAEPIHLDRGVVAENIFSAAILREETEALCIVEPLDSSSRHIVLLVLY